jgi:hypothetical protein
MASTLIIDNARKKIVFNKHIFINENYLEVYGASFHIENIFRGWDYSSKIEKYFYKRYSYINLEDLNLNNNLKLLLIDPEKVKSFIILKSQEKFTF